MSRRLEGAGGGGEGGYRREVLQVEFLQFMVFGFRVSIWTKILITYINVTNRYFFLIKDEIIMTYKFFLYN